MASSYSAIKIPVVGNLIDTPNAVNGHLLHFQDGVFTNFKPLIVDMRPDTGARQMSFAVSVDGGSNLSWEDMTETGMVFSKDDNSSTANFKLTVNSNVIGNATLDVKGDVAIGSDSTKAYKFPNGTNRPSDWLKQSVPVVDPNGIITFKTLQGYVSSDGTIEITDNKVIVARNTLSKNLYNATNGVQITGNDAISGSDIQLDLDWCRTDNVPDFKSTGIFHCTGGLVNNNGVLSVNLNKMANQGLFTTDQFFSLKQTSENVMNLALVKTKCGEDGAIFKAGTGVTFDGFASDVKTINTPWRVRETDYNSNWVNLDGSLGATGDAVMFAMEGDLSTDHLRIEGGWVFPLTGGLDDGPVNNERHFVQVLKNVHDSFGSQNDGGGLKIQTTDYNDDEYAIHCESLVNHDSGNWLLEGGFDSSKIDLGANSSIFYVRAKSGAVYSAGGLVTEGRIHIGHYDAMKAEGYVNHDGVRYSDNMPGAPAHITITSESPTVLLNQVDGDATAPTIMMTSMNAENKASWGVDNGAKQAYTNISNRDSRIICIESSTTGGTGVYTENDSSEHRLNVTNRTIAWSLDYYTDASSGELKIYQRMGASGHGSTSAGTHYLPIGTNTAPTGVEVGGMWLDAGDTTPDGKNYTVRMRIT